VKNKPPYALESVDNALRLVQLVRDHGRIRVSEAAQELGIARSTAHRLLAMLVYRGFAVQDETRGYVPGAALGPMPALGGQLRQLRASIHPYLDELCERVGETVSLVVRVGTQARFLASVESTQVLHVGDRAGTVLPAAKTSGGKALLAELSPAQLRALYRPKEGPDGASRSGPLSPQDWDRLGKELDRVRATGYSVNHEETEVGVCAVGVALHDPTGLGIAALSVAVPTVRYRATRTVALAKEIQEVVESAERGLWPSD
jgi:IclR family transcriptional regulator, acetate operon repressor